MKKILITATELHIIQFWLYHIENLIKNGFEVELVCSHVGDKLDDLKEKLKIIGNPKLTVVDLKRNPLSLHNIHGYFQLRKYLAENKYDIIITNEPVMGVMTRLAARTARKKFGTKVIYFAHGFHFWKGAPVQNWLIFYPIEKIGSHFADIIVTMNEEDYHLAKNHFNSAEIKYTYGIGADLSQYSFNQQVREEKRKSLNLNDSDFMLFSTSELTKRKNIRLAIDVVNKLVSDGYNVKFFVRGKGNLLNNLNNHIKELNLENSVFLLGYGKDVKEMCMAADVFLFTSVQEGLPVAVMEAMSCSLPCVVSKIRGVTDLVKNGKSGYVCSLDNIDEFVDSIKLLADNKDTDLKQTLTKDNKKVLQPYAIENVFQFIEKIISDVE